MTIIVAILLTLACLELVPLVATAAGVNNYGATRVGRVHQWLNAKLHLGTLSWWAFDVLLFVTLAYTWSSRDLDVLTKSFVTCALLWIAYACVYNTIMTLYYWRDPPIFAPEEIADRFPAHNRLVHHCDKVRDEFHRNDVGPCVHDIVSGFQISVPRDQRCWRAIVLKKQGRFVPGAREKYPTTCSLVADSNVHTAMFSILDAGVSIPPHFGYYKGYLRYHLGIEIPRGPGRPYIVCGGQKYTWKNCDGVLFDDMFLHDVVNESPHRRVVLYLDVLRHASDSFWLTSLHRVASAYIETHPVLKRIVDVQHKPTGT
jgi:aspartate beta-hydroxylase